MGLYGFKKQFVPCVLDGSKTHTIRAERRLQDKPGNTMHLFYALRTKQCEFLLRAPCVKVEPIAIYRAQVWLNGEELSLSEKDLLAWRDGFRYRNTAGTLELTGSGGCFDLMLQYWAKNRGPDNFTGRIFHWDYQRAVFEREAHQAKCQHG